MHIGPRALTTAAAVLLLAAGCGGGKEPKTLPPQTVSQAGLELEAPPPLPAPVRQVHPPPVEVVKVIDPGDDPGPKTLVEASRLAKAKKATSAPSVLEVTDENLKQHAAGGQVTIMSSAPAAPAADAAAEAAAEEGEHDEPYWRRRGLSIRRSWRSAIDTIDRLELEAASLRQQFYAEDDPYVRDNRIKPAWDRALDRISDLHEDAQRYEQALGEYLEEGRQEGVPAGWLNDGWELEPDAEELDKLDGAIKTQDAVDTPILEQPARDIESGGGGR